MNSALQCLSHTLPFTTYFLAQLHVPEINEENVLGARGKLAREYAAWLNEMWTKKSSIVTPLPLKDAVSTFRKQFQGYLQQDAQEFLICLLDGLVCFTFSPYVSEIVSHLLRPLFRRCSA
jgi:ubiquitin C-terminal hydrolase